MKSSAPTPWIDAGDGLQVRLDGARISMRVPPGMTKAEAMLRIQPRIDAANAATKLDIQMVWAEERSNS